MKKFKKIALTILCLIAIYEIFLWKNSGHNKDFSAIDSCLDHGGCWDKVVRVCRQQEPNANELCQRK